MSCEYNCRLYRPAPPNMGDGVSYLDLNIYPSICHRSVQAILFSKGVRESQPFKDRGSSINVQLQLLNNRLSAFPLETMKRGSGRRLPEISHRQGLIERDVR